VKIWVGVTHNDWFDFLSRQQPEEVNFWQPSGTAPFVQLPPGAPFLFKLKKPFNHIAGGAYFVKFTSLPMSMVWEVFAERNGARSRAAFERLIRPLLADPTERDPPIGCTVLSSPFFLERPKWIEAPTSWAGNIVRGRYYDTTTGDGVRLWQAVQQAQVLEGVIAEEEARYGDPVEVQLRLGQGAFRVLVTDAYRRRCAITGEKTLPALEAAHIRPYSEGGPHALSNGLLLRSDFHRLFDAGLVTITPNLQVEVSPRIREEWFNGVAYYRLHGKSLAILPDRPEDRPKPGFLAWHNEHCYRG
jgi:putative restriction endonuclease